MLCPPGLPGWQSWAVCLLLASPPKLAQPSLPHCWLVCHPGMPVTLGKRHWKSPGSLSQGVLMVSEKVPKFTWEDPGSVGPNFDSLRASDCHSEGHPCGTRRGQLLKEEAQPWHHRQDKDGEVGLSLSSVSGQLLTDVCPHSCHCSGLSVLRIASPRTLLLGLHRLTTTAKPQA